MSGKTLSCVYTTIYPFILVLVLQWRFCDYRKHAWVVRVGTVDSVHTRGKEVDNLFESLHHFATYCQSINIDLAVEGNFVNVSVVDTVEGRIHVAVDRRK